MTSKPKRLQPRQILSPNEVVEQMPIQGVFTVFIEVNCNASGSADLVFNGHIE